MEILILALLVLLNGLFSMSEMAVVSSRKARLQQYSDEKRPGAGMALALANQPSIFLSTIQVGITIIGITSGAFGEAALAGELSAWLSQWPMLDRHSNAMAIAIVVAGIALASLIIGELVPKRLALLYPEAIASVIAGPMMILSRITYPLVKGLSMVTEGALRIFGMTAEKATPVTEEEINVLMEQGAEAGVFVQHEQELVSRVLRLDDVRVSAIMTTRNDIVYLDVEGVLQKNIEKVVSHGHSRYPVARTDLDHVEGIVMARTLLTDALSRKELNITSALIPAVFVPGSASVIQLLELFKSRRQTAALVVGEGGDIRGLVTLNDVMEALVGDIATVHNEAERDIVKRGEDSWLVDGDVTLGRLEFELEMDEVFPQDDGNDYQTIGGFIMHRLGRIPVVADRFAWNGWSFEVVDMDKRRVDKILLTRLPEAA
jgi:putative hemolysin